MLKLQIYQTDHVPSIKCLMCTYYATELRIICWGKKKDSNSGSKLNPAILGVDKDVRKTVLSYTLAETETGTDFGEKWTSKLPNLGTHSKTQGIWRLAIKFC